MIQTGFESRVKIQQIISNQLPEFILEESPKASEFLKQYYISQEYQGGPVDIAENLDQYLKLDNLTPEVVVGNTILSSNVTSTDKVITVTSTKGFPQNYGLLKIDGEIITYTGLTTNTFTGCVRGFSGITSYHADLNQEELVFSTSNADPHVSGSTVQNLSSLFLKEFYKKLKYSLTPGLENVDFVSDLNVGNFIKNARSFYQSKGTDESFRILFNVLYGVTPRVVNLEDFLIKPSSAEYVRREVVSAERISGDPSKLVGQSIFKSTDLDTNASVSEVEIFTRKNKTYYKLSLFIGYEENSAIQGNFTITQNTKCLENVSIGASVISVDSTIGFAGIGTIISGINTITYTSKSINQFFGCTGITSTINCTDNVRSDETYYGYEDGDESKKVELRFTGVLSEFVPISESFKVSIGDEISIKGLGEKIVNPDQNLSYKQIFANSWLYNTSSRYEINSISGSSLVLKSPIDRSSLKEGDQVEILERNGDTVIFPTIGEDIPYVSKKIINNSYSLELNNFIFNPTAGKEYDLRRRVNKANSSNVPIKFGNDSILSDIQNVYTENDEYMYVASNSLPSNNRNIDIPYAYQITKNINSVTAVELDDFIDNSYTSIISNTTIPFISGDIVYYNPQSTPISGLTTGYYYVDKITSNKIRLYSSKSFIGSDQYLTYESSTISPGSSTFTLASQKSAEIGPQKLLKKFSLPQNIKNGSGEITTPGSIGMLINGVEILNYKSNDKIYYGPLESIEILNGGKDYDVINPPVISISSGVGITALVQPVLKGSIEKVIIDPQDFDINYSVLISASGGNGYGAVFEPIIQKRVREVYFDARLSSDNGGVNIDYETLYFLKDHNFKNGEEIVYNSNGNLEIGIGTYYGSNNTQNRTLVNNARYYTQVENNRTIKLYSSSLDYLAGINTIGFTSTSNSGIHKFSTISNKNTISEIKVIHGGEEYQNRKLIVKTSGISTITNTVNFKNHGFNDGELIEYKYQSSPIVGLTTLNQYYISKLDVNSFRLCDAGIGGTNSSNYVRKNYIKLLSTGSGYQYFSYPDISVSVTYSPVGFGTTTQVYSITATPTVRGSIIDAYLYENGTGYGTTILNFHKKPSVSIKNGKEAQLKPVIINGMLDSVSIQYAGYEYYSIPDLIISDASGSGSGAKLKSTISNGRISNVTVINPGIGYSDTSTSIQVKPSGINALFDANVRSLTLLNNVRFGNELLLDNGDTLQYSVCGYFETLKNSLKDDNSDHSPIIGWSYDGNPIYGPYGYPDPNLNSEKKVLTSGYTLNTSNIIDRPNNFANGFFVEDYIYTNSGDLDEYNGRFGKTKEFPKGVYAYFATIDPQTLKPIFPYFIGNKYRSNFIEDNSIIDQSFDFNNSKLIRNTFPYKISDQYANNDFIVESNEFSQQKSVIESVTEGYVNDFDILNSGLNYKVGDSLEFDNTNTSGGGLLSKVSSIKGKDIVNVSTSTENYLNAIFSWKNEREINVSILPNHNLSDNDTVIISGFSTNLAKLNGSYKIGVTSYTSSCISTVTSSTAGLSTEIYVAQFPLEAISIGSSIMIGSETLKVLEVFENLNILKVQRGLTGVSHTATTQINFIPNSFIISKNIDYFDSKPNDKVYFNPRESVGVGTTTGITNSITFSFGDSTITRSIPTKGIFIENHPFKDNQQVVFNTNGAASISISTSASASPIDLPSVVYIANKNINTIGIKTQINGQEVFFRSNGDDNDGYSFESSYTQVIGNVKKIKSTVSVSTYHELTGGDIINLSIKPNLSVGIGTSTSISVKRDTTTGNILINPIGFNSTGINTSTSRITINSHNLNTGDKVLYSANIIASGLSTGAYYIYKIDDNTIKLSETYSDCTQNTPITVSIASTGGSNQTISRINPQIKSIKNNNLVFKLSDSSLLGYEFKIYYDADFNNEFVSTGSANTFSLIGVGTAGVSSTASLSITYDENLSDKLYYNLEKSGYISTSDKEVVNASQILFVDSAYKQSYNVFGIGSTTFSISLNTIPEKLSYSQSECSVLEYSTSSKSAQGAIDKIDIISGGTGYKKLPIFTGSNSENGTGAYIVPKSTTIGNPKEVRIINEGFEYSSDKTLNPIAYISPLITIDNSNTISNIEVINSGKNYTYAPSIQIVNSKTGEEIDSGILNAILTGSSIASVNILQEPKGLPSTVVNLFATNNTNGISIEKVESSSTGIFTCAITTPTLGFSTRPFDIGDQVFVEGIQKYGSGGSGFNSKDYGYKFFTVSNYNDSGTSVKVTVDISSLTSNTGIAKTIQDLSGNIVKYSDYPTFKVTQKSSSFLVGEKIILDGNEVDLIIANSDNNFIKVYGSYELSVGEVITGKESGNIATISKIDANFGKFEINYSVRKTNGWSNDIGKLNQDNQSISDNDYYQNLAYTIKSPIQYEDLRTPVNSLLHTSGLKNFSDTGITSSAKFTLSSKEYLTTTNNIINENRVDTIYNFDLSTDVDLIDDKSKFIKLKTKRLSDYIECISNRVLKIDNISSRFSNEDGSPSEFLNILKIDSSESYDNLLFRITDPENSKIQLTEIVLLNNSNDTFILQKGTVYNVGLGFTSYSTEEYGNFSIITDIYDDTYLRFNPTNPYDYDYDIKVIKSNFNSTLTGIGTKSIGFIDLTGSNITVNAGLTNSIISIPSNKIEGLYANVQIINTNSNQMNFVELYLNYDGTNTYISEYYFDSESSSNNYSGNLIGTFGANISSGVLSLNYTNNSTNSVSIRSKIVGFGTTAVGTGVYRFKSIGEVDGYERSAILQSNYSSNVSSASTIISTNANDFNAIRSLVKVSVGTTSAIHRILTIHDNTHSYVQQENFTSIGNMNGIGTFGSVYSGNDFKLIFYPDANITGQIKISSFNECLYNILDSVNVPEDLSYGSVTESIDVYFYNGINGNRVNRTEFNLTSNNYPIFAKTFNPQDSLVLNPSTGIFTISNHFFSNAEKLIYTPKSTFIGIGESAVGIGSTLNSAGIVTNRLPSEVYVIKDSEDTFKLSTRKDYALLGIGVTFTSYGLGNAHKLEMDKKNEKVIISIDNVTQYPLTFTPINYNLSGNGGQIGTYSTYIALSGISSIFPKDILKVDNEYMNIVSVGLGTTNVGPITNSGSIPLVLVSRGFVGSSVTTHTDSTNAGIYRGSYNIVGNSIFFVESPRGNPQIIRDSSNLTFETSDFAGRVYLRNDYTTNKIYDDISDKFTGIGRTFTLTVGGANTVGLGTTAKNGILFINGIFQTPSTDNNPSNNFNIIETSSGGSGITSVVFSGITDDNGNIITSIYDVNQNQTPRGGLIISLGSSIGLGYAPLVGAAVTAVVGAGGSIVSVGFGTTDILGSGYNGIVSIGVTVYQSGHAGVGSTAIITATVGAGGTLAFSIGYGGTGYTNPKIFVSPPSYENLEISGVSRLGIGSTSTTGIGLLLSLDVQPTSTTGIGSTYFEVSSFKISRQGYSFRRGDVFKPVGLVTDRRLSSPLSEFTLTVLDTFTDSFAFWQFGEFDYIDSVKNYQDGIRTRFPLFYNSELLSFETANNSPIDLNNLLLIIINGVIQDPGVSYNFNGGTSFVFTTAPKKEDNISIFFYRGTTGEDSKQYNVTPTVKKGDFVQIFKNNNIPGTVSQNERTIFNLSYSDKFETNLYSDLESIDTVNNKPISWTKQKVDSVINGDITYKTRDSLESRIYPTVKIIKDFSSVNNEIFIDYGPGIGQTVNVFNYELNAPGSIKFDALVISGTPDPISGAVSATVSAAGTIQSLTITNPGSGYTGSTVTAKIAAPLTVGILTALPMGVGVGIGSTATATITVSAAGTLITPINITNPGLGYSTGIIPQVIVPLPSISSKYISEITIVQGFSGIITGITTTTGTGGNPLALKFYLRADSFSGTGLTTGYPIYINNTSVGAGVTSIDSSNSAIVGIGSTFLDNIYYVHSITPSGSDAVVISNINSNTSVVGIATTGTISNPVGKFSWGRLSGFVGGSNVSIGVSGKTVDVGLSTFPSIQRRNGGFQLTGALLQ